MDIHAIFITFISHQPNSDKMKGQIGILIMLICLSCSQKNSSPRNFDWLAWSWIRTNDKEGNITYEHWTKNSDIEYKGLGYTLQNSDTIFKEQLRLIKINEFPKNIMYSVHDNVLLAKISDEETEITFSFEKILSK